MRTRSTITRAPLTENAPFVLSELQSNVMSYRLDHPPELEAAAYEAARVVESFARVALLRQLIRIMVIDPVLSSTTLLPIGPVSQDEVPVVSFDGERYSDFDFRGGDRPYIVWRGDFSEMSASRMMITYKAGFGETAYDIPPDLARAVIDETALILAQQRFGDSHGKVASSYTPRIGARCRDGQI
ncbi:hypothetical protein C6W92_06115 [Roseovarius sp. A46]|uniref:hypothetical protein n=1 Tax=Roseovarius sp. A46 TaxID=2109331 RepID=UPI00101347CE|nr:hypothetical protein [Roseovarius sp. A46]RXV64871.1 hypothetical protein C6W92_06115 [Roseovarius sp. A46]